MMNIIWWVIIGLVAGALARLLMPGKDSMGILMTIILGIVGSVIGGFISGFIWKTTDTGFHPGGLIMSVIGAILVLIVWRMIKGGSS